jgi:hypothetical protein
MFFKFSLIDQAGHLEGASLSWRELSDARWDSLFFGTAVVDVAC